MSVRKRVVVCDVCKNEILHNRTRYKYKRHKETYVEWGDLQIRKMWTKLDMCDKCYLRFKTFLKNEAEN